MHKISVIIPIYNVEKYLSVCLESVINQSYQNLEIILVDDGSTDACPKICDEYAAKDNRIKLIHKKNGGLSDARNIGVKHATGNLISFVDSDDVIALDFYEKLINILEENDADIVECGFRKFYNEKELSFVTKKYQQAVELFETEIAIEQIFTGLLSVVVWNKLYKKQIVDCLEFPINRINEDEFWTYKVFAKAKKIVKIQEELYYYRQQPESIIGKQYSIRRLDGLQAQEERIWYMKDNFPRLENLAIKTFCFISMHHYHQLVIHHKIDPERVIRKKIYSKVKHYQKWSILKKWHWKDIVWFLLFFYSPKNYIRLRDYMDRKVEKKLNNEL